MDFLVEGIWFQISLKQLFHVFTRFTGTSVEYIIHEAATKVSTKHVSESTHIIVNKIPRVKHPIVTFYERTIILKGGTGRVMLTNSYLRPKVYLVEVSFNIKDRRVTR